MRLLTLFSLFGGVQAIIKGINIYGLETQSRNFACSWVHDIDFYIDKVYELGFNSLRVPFSYEWFTQGDFSKMDHMFDSVHGKNMTVILDMHRIWSYGQSPVPTDGITMKQFLDTWVSVADRYKDRPELVGLYIFNEYQGGDTKYWNNFMRETVVHLEERFPNRFTYFCGGTNWGGNLAGIGIEDLPFKDRIRYSIHKYIFSGNSVPSDWDVSFGSYPDKVVVDEWGFKNQDDQKAWARMFVDYLKKRNIRDNYFWCLGISGDTGGLYQDDCETIEWEKFEIIKSLWNEEEKKEKLLRGSHM